MKYKIQKLQSGGGMATFTPLMASSPASQASPTGQSAPQEERGNELLDSETYKTLMSKGGLKNDVNRWVDEIVSFEGSSDFPYLSGGGIEQTAFKIKRLNEIIRNKELWNDTITTAQKQGGLNEVAVGTSGELFVRGEGATLKSISMQEYSKNRDKYNPLTFYELMIEREINPNLAFNNNIFAISATAIGSSQIIENITQLVEKVGSYTHTTTTTQGDKELLAKAGMLAKSMTGKQPSQTELEALSRLETIVASPANYTEVKESSKSSEKYLGTALSYIWTSLPKEQQLKLSAIAVMSGVNDPKEFIYNMLKANKDESYSLDVSPISDEKAIGRDSAASTSKTVALSTQELFHMDRLHQPGMTYQMNTPNANVKLNMTATGIGPLFSLQKSGQVIEGTVLTDILQQGNYSSIVDPNQAYLGNVKIDPMALEELAYTGGDVAKVYVPVKNGVPDYEQMDKFNDAYQVFNINKDKWTTAEAEDYFKKSGFSGVRINEVADKNGVRSKVIVENSSVTPFLAVPVMTNSASDLADIPWMVEVMGEEKKPAKELMKSLFTSVSGVGKNAKVIPRMPKAFLSLEDPYKGTVLIAYRPEAHAILSSSQGNLVGTAPTETDVYRNLNYSAQNYSPGSINASASVL